MKEVASALGGVAERESSSWPDGWVVLPSGERIPVEVVDAYERPAEEDPKKGATWVKAYKGAERDARAQQEATGQAWGWGAHEGRGYAVPIDGTTPLPLRMQPVHPARWVVAAVRQKIQKRYGPAAQTILAVRLVNWMPLERWEIEKIAQELSTLQSPFKQVWVINEFGRPPQEVSPR